MGEKGKIPRDLYDRAQALANEIALEFSTIEHWNRIHPDEEPIDPDPDGTLRGLHAYCVGLLRREPVNSLTPEDS